MPDAFTKKFSCIFVITTSGSEGWAPLEDISEESAEFGDILVSDWSENRMEFSDTLDTLVAFSWFSNNCEHNSGQNSYLFLVSDMIFVNVPRTLLLLAHNQQSLNRNAYSFGW